MKAIPHSHVRRGDDFRFTIVMAFGVLAVLPPVIAEEAGTTVLMVTHSTALADHMQRRLHLSHGRINA